MPSEAVYQNRLIKKLERLFPGCFIMKNDPAENQGIPDLLILYRNMWAMLETKKSNCSSKQPNQDYYVNKFGEMSFASFICPENEIEVLDELRRSMEVSTRVS